VTIDHGDGNTTDITNSATKTLEITYSEDDGAQFTPTATLVVEYGDDPVESSYEPYNLENAPIILTYYEIATSINPDEGAIPFDVTFSLTVTPVNDFTAAVVSECKVRPTADDAYTNITLESGTTTLNYDTFGKYTLDFTTTYENSRGYSRTETAEYAVKAYWVGEATFSPSHSGGTSDWSDDPMIVTTSKATVHLWDATLPFPVEVQGYDCDVEGQYSVSYSLLVTLGYSTMHYNDFDALTVADCNCMLNIGRLRLIPNIDVDIWRDEGTTDHHYKVIKRHAMQWKDVTSSTINVVLDEGDYQCAYDTVQGDMHQKNINGTITASFKLLKVGDETYFYSDDWANAGWSHGEDGISLTPATNPIGTLDWGWNDDTHPETQYDNDPISSAMCSTGRCPSDSGTIWGLQSGSVSGTFKITKIYPR